MVEPLSGYQSNEKEFMVHPARVHPHNRARRRLATENYILPATVIQSPKASRGNFMVTHGWIVDSPEGGGLGPGRGSKGTPGALGVNSLCAART